MEQELYDAASKGRDDLLTTLLQGSADINKSAREDCGTPLLGACLYHNISSVHFLLAAKAGVNIATIDDGTTPLFVAAEDGKLDIVKALLNAGANFEMASSDDGATPLHIAAQRGRSHVVDALIEAKAQLDRPMLEVGRGSTPLNLALDVENEEERGQNVECVLSLLRNRASPAMAGFNGMHGLLLALAADDHPRKRCSDLIRGIFEMTGPGERKIYLEECPIIECRMRDPLLLAASTAGNWRMVKALLELKALPDQLTGDRRALFAACCQAHEDVVMELLHFKADPMSTVPFIEGLPYGGKMQRGSSAIGSFPLYAACGTGSVKNIELLLNAKASPNQCRLGVDEGLTGLHLVAQEGHLTEHGVPLVRTLVEAGALLNLASTEGLTPLHLAAQHGHVETVKELIQLKADMNLRSRSGLTPLVMATNSGHHAWAYDSAANVNGWECAIHLISKSKYKGHPCEATKYYINNLRMRISSGLSDMRWLVALPIECKETEEVKTHVPLSSGLGLGLELGFRSMLGLGRGRHRYLMTMIRSQAVGFFCERVMLLVMMYNSQLGKDLITEIITEMWNMQWMDTMLKIHHQNYLSRNANGFFDWGTYVYRQPDHLPHFKPKP